MRGVIYLFFLKKMIVKRLARFSFFYLSLRFFFLFLPVGNKIEVGGGGCINFLVEDEEENPVTPLFAPQKPIGTMSHSISFPLFPGTHQVDN